MIVGIGTDLASVERIAGVLERQGREFAERILTLTELQRFDQLANARVRSAYLAKRFAAKEAASKALGTGIAEGVSFQDFQIDNAASGAPTLSLSGVAKQRFDALGANCVHITLTDERRYAQAFVIYEARSQHER